jgi:xanthine dehydrogenase molybdenum-binding subunit
MAERTSAGARSEAVAESKLKLVGQNYITPDLVAKVTGRARYAEDFRAEGMLFAKLLLSPMPHARITRIDTSEAEAMPGVRAILRADDLPAPADSVNDFGQTIKANPRAERALTNEPLYEGEPILAVAAVDELTATEAIERIRIELEPLPFAVDPVASLRPGSPSARTDGNIWFRPPAEPGAPPPPIGVRHLKWTETDFAGAAEGQLPIGEAVEQWSYGDVEKGFADAALVLDETFVTPNTTHHTMEPRSAMAYWENGKLHIHCSTQSTVQTLMSVSRWLQMPPTDIVLVSEYTGGGFGSKATGTLSSIIPALLSKKAGAPVMMRISREEEHYIGRARPALHGRLKAGFSKEGRLLALDMFAVAEAGPYEGGGDHGFAAVIVSLMYQPVAMKFRGVGVMTNTPPRGAQRAPGGAQGIALIEPVISKAARQLGIDQVAMRVINAPAGKASFGPPNPKGTRGYTTSAFVKEALHKGADLFGWEERKARGRVRSGSKVRGVGVAMSTFVSGSTGFDGLLVIKPDGRLAIQSGVGNLGTESFSDVNRVAAEILGVPWEKCDVAWGSTARNLPWTCVSGGSQTTHAMTRAAHAAAMDARKKLQEVAAKTLGGSPDAYSIANERVSGNGRSMSLAQAATKAIELGGVYDGHEVPADVNDMTKRAAAALAGQGLMGVARDKYPRDGQSFSTTVGFAEVEVDTETGAYSVVDFVAVADVGTVIHPRSLGGQILGGSLQGMGHAMSQKWVYDQHYGVPLAKRFYQNRPPTILDAPARMRWAAVEIPDPETPVGARGVGEPPVGAGFAAVLNALADAVGDEVFKRAPVTADMILEALEHGRPMHEPLTANI